MAGTERVLVDTSALYAIFSENDLFHDRARAVYEHLINANQEIWTTSYALVETVALLHRRLGFEVVSELSEWRLDSNLQVFWIDGRIHAEAWDRFMAGQGRGLSFVDWTTAVVSRDMGAPVFTFDQDFVSEGLPIVTD